MAEPDDLTKARNHLAKAESMLMSKDGLFHLEEGLAFLEALIDGTSGTQHASVASNLGQTYTNRVYARFQRELEKNKSLPEPRLEHMFAVIRAFDDAPFDLPPEASRLKIEVVRHLIDLYYEGHTPAEKEAAYAQLAAVARDRTDT